MWRRRPTSQVALLAALALALPATALLAPGPSRAQEGLGELRSRAERQRERERALAGQVARLDRLVARLQADLAVVARRAAAVQAQLDADRLELARVRGALRAERARVVRLRRRLAQARAVLAQRLVQLHRAPRPDVVTVVMSARGFADLLEQAEYVRRIAAQDVRIIEIVRAARREATDAVTRLARDEARQARITAAVQARRDALAAIEASLGARRAALAAARAARAGALASARADRQSLERRVAALEAQRARAARAVGPGGPWAIPWAVVQCESGGQNLPPNWAGASGYYQFLPATWKLYGGSTPHAYLASKAEQDRIAARAWRGGAGASQWVCASLVGVI